MHRHRGKAGTLADAVGHFRKVARSYRPGLFHCYAVPGLPRTNNDLEHLFGAQRYHERRASGRKAASPATVLRGEVRLIAATATRIRPIAARELGRVSREAWTALRRHLDQRRHARALRTRFRRDPDAYLAALENLVAQGGDPGKVASVASFFVSRIDVAVDGLIEERLRWTNQSDLRATLSGLRSSRGVLQFKIAAETRMKRTPTVSFHYDETIEQGVRISRLLEEQG